jgi:potassium-transporting ATPase KdpC subunit
MDSLCLPFDDLYFVNRLHREDFGHFTMILKNLLTSVVLLLILTAVTGVIYPLLVTGIAQAVFPAKANGSLITRDGNVAGSELIGQPFSDPRYFWGRPSATTPFPYNAAASSGSNLGPLNPALLDAVGQRVRNLKAADSLNAQPIPVDLVTASGSGLDPHISIQAALYQVPRVARARGLSETRVRTLVHQRTEGRQFEVLGEPRVNVLLLNLDLDGKLLSTAGR